MSFTSDKSGEKPTVVQKWCKASWFKKGSSGTEESEAVPRCWVSRSQGIIRWPPAQVNFKTAIENCLVPSENALGWSSYKMTSCTHSVDSLEDAMMLQTEMTGSESEEIHEQNQQILHRRGQRNKKGIAVYHENNSDNETEYSSSATNREQFIERTLVRLSGETSSGSAQPQSAKKKTGSESSDTKLMQMLSVLQASSRVHHNELLEKISHLERKVGRMAATFTSSETSSEVNSNEEEDETFIIDLPAVEIEDFDELEKQLKSDLLKRRGLRNYLQNLGGRTENEIVLKCISAVIKRPNLAQHFNCGGILKTGTLVQQPTNKRNFMGTECQKIGLRVLRKRFPLETENSFRSRASEVLKRSSGLRGGVAYKAKQHKQSLPAKSVLGSQEEDDVSFESPPNKKRRSNSDSDSQSN